MQLDEIKLRELNEQAEEILAAKNLFTIPIDIVKLVREDGFLIQTLKMDSETTGMLLVDDKRKILDTNYHKVIIVKKDFGYCKSRFIVAHEYAHYCLHKDGETTQFAHRDYRKVGDDPKELEADAFARCLLMPENLVNAFVASADESSCYPEDEKASFLIEMISGKFNVSTQKANLRLKELKII